MPYRIRHMAVGPALLVADRAPPDLRDTRSAHSALSRGLPADRVRGGGLAVGCCRAQGHVPRRRNLCGAGARRPAGRSMDSAAGVHAARIGGGLRIERDQWHRRNTPLDVQFNQSPGPFNCIGDRRWRTLFSASQPAPIARTHDLFEAMRDDMNRVLERFEGGWSRWPSTIH